MAKIIGFIGTKGGTGKSTLSQCLSHSATFQQFKICLIEMDAQGSLMDWSLERFENKKVTEGKIPIMPFYDPQALESKIEFLDEKYDYIFIDGAGESIAKGITAFIIAISDILIIPQKLGTKDLTSYLKKLFPIIQKAKSIEEFEGKFYLLASNITPNTNPQNIYDFLEGEIPVMKNLFYFRKIYESFSDEGMTLQERLADTCIATEKKRLQKAIDDIEAIAQELHNLIKLNF